MALNVAYPKNSSIEDQVSPAEWQARIDLAAGHLLHHLLLFTQRHVKFLLIDRAPINRGDRGRGFAAAQVRIDTKKKEWRNDQQRQNQLQRTFVPVNKIKHVQYTLI